MVRINLMRRLALRRPGTASRSPTAASGFLLLPLCLALVLPGCRETGSYAGIRFVEDAEARYRVNLAWDASRGNPRAQLELGMLYETGGRGLARNPTCAARLYEAAAAGDRGLPEARARLERMSSRIEEAGIEPGGRCEDVAERTRLLQMTPEERDAWYKGRR